jgi:hypothetical protein
MTRSGDRLRTIAARVCSAATMERLIDPLIADLQTEYAEALRHGRFAERQAAGGNDSDPRHRDLPHHDRRTSSAGCRSDRPVRERRRPRNVIASTDCGFAQVEHIQRVHPQGMWAKLGALAEGAR